MVAQGYAGGVPMGGDLPAPPQGADVPRFVVSAVADPGTARYPGNLLQRLQIVKGWYADGQLHEEVLDVVGGDNGAGVDPSTCKRHGPGETRMCAVWRDDAFAAQAPAFYYARLLENPGCRWSQYICVDAGVQCDNPQSIPEGLESCCAPEHKKVIQERAWSSPIWYTPG